MTFQVLTPIEARVVSELVVDGESNIEIAARLEMSRSGIEQAFARAMRKTGCRTRTSLALWWIRRGRYEHSYPELETERQS